MEHRDSESRIMALLERMREAWRKGDAQAYARCFTPQADYISFDGVRAHGRAEIDRTHGELFAFMPDSVLVTLNTDIRFIRDDIARVIVIGAVLLPWQSSAKKGRLSIGSAVAVRQDDGGWLFDAFQNTRVNPRPVPKGIVGNILKTMMRLMPARTASIHDTITKRE
ncbi:SgcJ/EcaC family oxidoreductase [Paracoccus pacificus]|uniref:SgcJ/EcaC family oxidoreductase n=1 Tax=Paracoccus pacificus TaxID=1463598 RepID=A0ABW4R5U8_9RHOB